MAERIASGEIHVAVDDDAAIAALRRIESDFARTMQRIDRTDAEVDLKADYQQLKRDLKRAEAEVRKYQKYVNDAESEYTRKARRESLLRAEARLKEAKAAEKAHRRRMDAASEQAKAEAAAEARRVAIERRAAQRERVFEQAEKRRIRAVNQESRVRASLDRQREREMARAHNAALLEERDRQNAITALERQERQVRKLQRQYSEAADKAEKLNRESRKVATLAAPGVRQRIDIAQREALAEMALLQAELKAMGARPIEQKVDLHIDERGVNTLNRWIRAITETTVRVGPLTTTIAGLARGLLLLGPIISGLVGQVAALGAGLGAGLVGAIGATIGALGALGVSLGGIGFLLPSLLREFGKLNQLQDAYRLAVLKYGRASDEAKKKLDQFNNALGVVAPTTRKAFLTLDELQGRWRRLSREARPEFFDMLGQGITTINFHFEWFRKNTLDGFDRLNAGWEKWMKGLRSDEAVRILRTLGKHGNESIRPLMDSLGNLATFFGRIAESFSRHLPGLIRGFRDWTGGLADAVDNSNRLNDRSKELVGSMRAVGHLIMAAARFITAFFNPGVDDGTKMIQSWADGLNRAAEAMRTTGRSGLNDWFRNSIELANQFWRALKPLAELFFEWTTIMAPFTRVALSVLEVLGEILQTLLGFGPTKTLLQTAFAIFLTGAILKRVVSMGSGLWSIAKALGAIKAAGGIGAALKGGIIRFATGGLRGQTPATPMYVMNVGPGAAVPGRGAPVGGGGGGVLGRIGPAARVGGGIAAGAAAVVTLTKALDDLHRKKGMENLDRKLSQLVRRRDMQGLINLRREIEDFGGGDAPAALDRVAKAMDAMTSAMSADARRLVGNIKTSWNRVHNESKVTFERVKNLATFNFRVIEENVGKHSFAAQQAASKNFWQARRAIKSSIEAGTIDTKKGHALIERLWVKALQFYGFSPKQARNIHQGRSYTGGREEGQSGFGKARGGLMNIGRPGVRARDNVPAMLGGQPAIVAEGEQVAVFNRHQQAAMDRMLPGGLEGFFAGNNRPHYLASGGIVDRYQGGGIVPVPGFPGERAASSILDEIAWVVRKFGVILTDAFGPGHASPGHTIHGTAADFAGPDRNMDAAVRALVQMGYLVGYDGRFGSQDWPGHGPASGQGGGNAHLHVEFGGTGGGLAPLVLKQIARVIMQGDLGAVSAVGQRVLDTTRDAANENLRSVAEASVAVPMAGGHGVGPGAGAATRQQMVRWATMALNRTRNLGHGGATAANIAKILELAMKESSWIVDSINNWDSNAAAGNPSGGLMHVTIDKVGGSKQALFDPVTNIIASIRYQMARYGNLITHSPYAMGGIIDQMGPSQWARGGKVNRPTLMTGEDGSKAPEYVISTNPAFRRNNISYLKQAAATLGVPMAREGKADKGRKPKFVRGAGREAENLPEVKAYGRQQKLEEDKRREISIAESRVREPDTLMRQVGVDPQGNPIYEVDQAKIDAYKASMEAVYRLYQQLVGPKGVLRRLLTIGGQAQSALNAYVWRRMRNIEELKEGQRINRRLLKSKDKDVRQKARERIEKADRMIEDQQTKKEGAGSTFREISEDMHDARFRIQEAQISRDDLRRDIDAVQGRAAADVAQANPVPEAPEAPTPVDVNDVALARLGAEQALAEIGQGIGGAPPRAMVDILTDVKRVQEARIAGAQAMLTDLNPANDVEAYGVISEAAGAIASLNEQIANTPGSAESMARDITSLSVALGDLGKTFGNNFSLASGMAYFGRASVPTFGAPTSPLMASMSGGGTQVVVNNTFPAPPPDPHTWSKGVAFELAAAL